MAARGRWWFVQPRHFLTWPVFVGSLAFYLVAHFTNAVDNSPGRVGLRLVLVVFSHLAQFGISAIAALAVRNWRRVGAANLVVVAGVAVGATCRGLLLAWLLYASGITDTAQWGVRTAYSVIQSMPITALLWVGVAGLELHLIRRRELLGERDRLRLLQDQAHGQLTRLGTDSVEAIRASIIAGIATAGTPEVQAVVSSLRATLDDVVRPLSHRLESETSRLVMAEPEPHDLRIDWREVIRDAAKPERIMPLLVAVCLAWLALAVNLVHGGALLALRGLAVSLTLGPSVFWVTKRAAELASRGQSWVVQAFAFVLALTAGGVLFGLASMIYLSGQANPGQFLGNAPALGLVLGVSAAVANSAQAQAVRVEADLLAATETLRWSLARVRERHRQQQRALTHALHGRVQAAIAAAILQLEHAAHEGAATAELIAGSRDRVVDVVTSLDLMSSQPDSLEEIRTKVLATWSGVVEITMRADPDVKRMLATDPLCLMTLNDLIPELVFNSVKHGRARRVELGLAASGGSILTVTATDDGVPNPTPQRAGLGTRLLDECSIEWQRQRSADRTVTEVSLPLAPGGQARVCP